MKKISKLVCLICVMLSAHMAITAQSSLPDARALGEKVGRMIMNQDEEFDYSNFSDEEFWGIISATDSIIEVVYKPSTYRGDVIEGDLNYSTSSRDFINARQAVLRSVMSLERADDRERGSSSIIEYEDPELPILFLKVSSLNSVKVLRNSRNVQVTGFPSLISSSNTRSARSTNFEQALNRTIKRNDSPSRNVLGCTNDASAEPKFTSETPGNYSRPWHYDEMNIHIANECSAGAGVKVAVFDTGLSQSQKRLSQSGFKKTYPNRKLTKLNTTIFNSDDKCGHGTFMAGIIAGPRYDSAVRGVAYESDLVSIKTNTQVLILTKAGLIPLASAFNKILKGKDGTGGTKIISMSLGYLQPSLTLNILINKLNKKGVLMFGAVGTSFNSEISELVQVYPAKHSKVVGVTGVKKGFPSTKKTCYNCHYGNAVDFVVPMEWGKDSAGKRILTHSLLRQNSAVLGRVGGSSIATATMAGAAAVIWSTPGNKNKSASEIKNLLRQSATSPNQRYLFYGWGVVDVAKAAGCTPDPCEGIECPPDQKCVNGVCVPKDPCQGVICPPGLKCVNGDCGTHALYCESDSDCGPGERCLNGKCTPY